MNSSPRLAIRVIHARIAEAASTAIQLGENWWGPHDMTGSIAAHASNHIMLDVMKIGGVSGWLRAAALAEAAGLSVSSHIFPEFSAHLLGVTPIGQWLEYLNIGSSILMEPVRIQDGYAMMPNRPGSGLAWNGEAVKVLARRLSKGPTRTYRLIKELMRTAVTSDLETTMRVEGELQDIAINTADHRALSGGAR